MADNIECVFWMSNASMDKMLYVSPAYEPIWERTRASLYEQPQSFLQAVHPEDRPLVTGSLRQKTLGEGIHFEIEYRIVRPNGSVRWIRDRGFPILDSNKELQHVVGIAEDITERKQVDERLRDQLERRERAEAVLARDEAELEAIYDHAPILLCLLDQQQRIRRVNRAAAEFASRPEEELIGRHGGELLGCLYALSPAEGCGKGPNCETCPLRTAVSDTLQRGATHRRLLAKPALLLGKQQDAAVLVSTARMVVAGENLVLLCIEDISTQHQAERRIRAQSGVA